MRVVVVGGSGAGKSTFARNLADACDLRHIELDALNWGPGWHNRSAAAPDEFARLIDEAIAGDRWVVDGNYHAAVVRSLPEATHLIWLDFSRNVVMRRVIWRSFTRVIGGREVWRGTGNREYFRRWLDRGYPIREAWDSFRRWRDYDEKLFADPQLVRLERRRLRVPREASLLIAELSAASSKEGPPHTG
jgi:adenylate kinase family enzyme